jgi:hypothetical protein
MGFEFAIGKNGEVTAEIDCQNIHIHQGYDGILHGGIIASPFDSAMVNCLFARGIVALTAEFKVRFKLRESRIAVGKNEICISQQKVRHKKSRWLLKQRNGRGSPSTDHTPSFA